MVHVRLLNMKAVVWRRLYNAFALNQNSFQNNNKILEYISLECTPSRFVNDSERFNILLEQRKPHLYCYDISEINKLNQASHNIKFNSEETNIIGIKDYFSIKNKIVYVRSFITFIKFRDYESINNYYEDSLFYFVQDCDNLKILKVKFNKQMDSSGTKQGHYLLLIYQLKPKEYFCTVEVIYSYSLKCSDQYDTTSIAHDYMGEDFYYSLTINYDPNEYTGFTFLRNQTTYEFNKDRSEIKIENFYKRYNDENPYENLILVKF